MAVPGLQDRKLAAAKAAQQRDFESYQRKEQELNASLEQVSGNQMGPRGILGDLDPIQGFGCWQAACVRDCS